jgi:hypothetical protein
VLALSEIASLLGKPIAPVLRHGGRGLAATALRRAGFALPPEMLQQLRYGRAIDNRRLKAAGYTFRATTRETVQAFDEHCGCAGCGPTAARATVRARGGGVPALEPGRPRPRPARTRQARAPDREP